MPRDTTNDTYTYTLIQQYVKILKPLTRLGQLSAGVGAVYGDLGLPMPREPYPSIYCFLLGIQPDYSGGSSVRTDRYTVGLRLIGGPATPGYKTMPEDEIYKLVTAIVNELDYRPFLQDPSNSDMPLRYIAPAGQAKVTGVGRIQMYSYGEQGNFYGVEIQSSVALTFNMGRLS